MEKSKRSLKIVQSISARHLPSILLKGRWLERAGFTIDMRVDVIVRAQCLVILPAANPPPPVSTMKKKS